MSESQHIKGACARCHGRIEFPAAAAGSTITCPHCGAATPLLPPAPATAAGMAKCACQHCHGRIEFPANAAGLSIACPHCGQQTVLSAGGAIPVPATAGRPAATPPPPPPGSSAASGKKPAAAQDAMSAALDEIAEVGTGPQAARKARAGGTGRLMLIAGLVVVLAGGAGAFLYLKKKPKAEAPKRSGKDLEVLQHALQKAKDGGLVYVVGTLTNHAPIQYFNLRVEFDLFDKTGTNKVGHTTDYVGNLGPTSAWTFKALVMEENATEVKLDKVMGEADTAAAAKKDGKGAGAK